MKNLIDFISKYKSFYIFGHRDPDADCICSQLALSKFLLRNGKKTRLFTELPLTRPEISGLGDYFTANTEDLQIDSNTAAVIVDCSTPERTGIFSDTVKKFPYAVIDHHKTGEITGTAGYIDQDAQSTTLLIYRLMKKMSNKPSREEAELLFTGFCTDTGFFRHLEEDSSEALTDASELIKAGVSPNKIFYKIHGNRTVSSRILLGKILARAESHFSGKLVTTYETYLDFQEHKENERDSDQIYQLLTATAETDVIAFIKEEKPDECSVSLRTAGERDLSIIAKVFKGGGHKKASGFSFPGNREKTKEAVLNYFSSIYSA